MFAFDLTGLLACILLLPFFSCPVRLLNSKYILDQGIAVKDRQERVLALLC